MKKYMIVIFLCLSTTAHGWFWSRWQANNKIDERVLQAIHQDHVRVLCDIFDHHGDVNAVDADGKTALILACEQGCSDSIHVLLTYNADVNRAEKKFGATALFYAVQRGDEVAVKKLIMSGAQVNICNKEGQTPLHIACYYGHSNVVELLLFASAQPDVMTKGKQGKSPLMYAARNGHAEVAKLLLEAGAKPDIATTQGKTALMYAATHGHPDVVRVLLAYNAKVDLKDKRGNTALYYASSEETKSVLLRAL